MTNLLHLTLLLRHGRQPAGRRVVVEFSGDRVRGQVAQLGEDRPCRVRRSELAQLIAIAALLPVEKRA
jgi:hypothetical protein